MYNDVMHISMYLAYLSGHRQLSRLLLKIVNFENLLKPLMGIGILRNTSF